MENELAIKEGPANHFKNIEGVGGRAYLTDRNFIFKSHSLNIQRHKLIIPLEEIAEVKATWTFGLIPNGLKITTNNSKCERFVVWGRKVWAAEIIEARNERLKVLCQ